MWRFFRESKGNFSATSFWRIRRRSSHLQQTASERPPQICTQESLVDGLPAINGGQDTTSQLVCFCILGLGLSLLIKFIYSEYLAFLSMRRALCKRDVKGKVPRQISMEDFMKYRADFHFSTNSLAKPMMLFGLTYVIILLSTIMQMMMQGESLSDSLWMSWTYVADPGTHAETKGLGRILGFATTIAGMLIFALMIGVVSDSIGARVDSLKKGTAKVMETGHTVILGWSEKGIALLQQIALANKSEGGLPIIVLCPESKEDMENFVNSACQRKEDRLELYGSRVIFRTGNPMNEHDLNQVSVDQARSIIVLSQGGIAPDDADSRTVRQILSLQQIKASSGSLSGHIVVELLDIDNLAMTKMVGKEDIEVIVSHELIGRLMLLAARSPWIAPVLSSLLGFEGSEFYFKEWPQLAGMTFGSICLRFDEAIPVGVKLSRNGQIIINPRDELVLSEGDQILVLAEDDDSYTINSRNPSFSECLLKDRKVKRIERTPERMLFCGWRRDMADMILELDYDVQPGSELWLFNTVPMHERAWMLMDTGNKAKLRVKNLRIRHAVGNPTSRRQLLSLLEVSDGSDGLPIGERTGHRVVLSYFSSILILSDSTKGDLEQDVEASDSRSLATTLGIQDIQQSSMLRMAALGRKLELFPPISEILDIRTAKQMQLISQGYVMSNHLVASYLAMVSEDRSVNKIYGELLSCRGSEIQIAQVANYMRIDPEEELSFLEVSHIVRSFNDLLIGYISHQTGRSKELRRGLSLESCDAEGGEILLNPRHKDTVRKWDPEDRLIIITLCHRATKKAELRELRSKAEKELLETTLSGENVAIYGWIKKLGTKRHHAIEMDDENSWRDRLAFVVDNAMYYVSEKRRGRELVCELDDIRHVEVGNGWPPGYFTFKVYLARDPEDGTSVTAEDLPLDSLPFRVFSTLTLEDCSAWVTVLSRGCNIEEQKPASYASSSVESPLARSSPLSRRMMGESGDHSRDLRRSPRREVMNEVQALDGRTESPTKFAVGGIQEFSLDLKRKSIDSIYSNLSGWGPGSAGRLIGDRNSLDMANLVARRSRPSHISTNISPSQEDSLLKSDGERSRWLQENGEDSQVEIKSTGWETMFPEVHSEWIPEMETRAGAMRPHDQTIELDDKD